MSDEPVVEEPDDQTPEEGTAGDGGLFEQPIVDAEEIHDPLDEDELRSALEAILLVVDSPVSVEALSSAIGEPATRIESTVIAMAADLTERNSGIDLRYAGDGWRYYTRQEFAPYVEKLLLDGARSKLTRAALETLAVIAYRQPVTRSRVSAVRGVNVDGVMRTLLARGLISEAGTDPDGGGILYVTTELFLERLGLASLSDLPDIAPLLPDVDVIDDIGDELAADPRFAKIGGQRADSTIDLGRSDTD
ncbi:SMC-Scp complex subunit ScpB [Williamsia serinedens]|uniref:Segregation and condensation protein B n=1 Tax=Williamsia serinedens TaxID=391736 RepID=A0ABT1GX19_9NOCA|nr:SMC-Scp complex subunit ScpB [Williamsia serinedens]MCP2159530.1 segregation and condensation protein B [Williamsia serinedens]